METNTSACHSADAIHDLVHLPAVADSLDADESDFMRSFVEQYLTSRGYSITSRNARVVVAAIARCRPPGLDAPTLEACIDRALDPELLRPAA